MAGNTFGTIFTITTFGESHGNAIGVVIDGCPPNIDLDIDAINHDMQRRRPGSSKITTPRNESDQIEILSGLFEGKTLGTPLTIIIRNTDTKPGDYKDFKGVLRPSHADFTYLEKYGIYMSHGGGRSSARETAARVAAGAVAKQILKKLGIEIIAYTKQIHSIRAEITELTSDDVEKNIVRCPDEKAAKLMEDAILSAKESGDSLGGIVECHIKNMPTGLGDPVFDKLDARLAHAMLSIPATKGFEVGSGFAGTELTGIEHNDPFTNNNGKIATTTNNSGGIQGGISNGMDIIFRVAFKPTSTIKKEQETVDAKGNKQTLSAQGRHDPCVVPRAIPIVEAMAAIVLADAYLIQKTIRD